ncbi:tetratricopeptide repeat protein [Anaeromyxobacter oryzisoli]|uniref:tetratricopeptide repeat protein n=1 Tax=Anaeromyxobacter oryzisoli TaxID=2925408 RepID=UPI001F55E54C|nr:tetratricopeptide repeat protein [Anaeromyxobacter sp. SG63]
MSKSTVITRKDMKEPDKFQEAATQAASWLASRKRHVLVAGAVAVVVILVVAIAALVQGRRQAAAGSAGAELLVTLAAPVGPDAVPGAPGPSFPTDEAKQRAIVAAADRLLAGHPGTGPGDLALLSKGDAHYALREWDAAKDAYEKFLAAAPRKDSLRFGALEGLALITEAKGDLDGAAKAYERMAKDAPGFADRADLERARVLQQAGKGAEAKAILAGFAKNHEKSVLVAEAAQRLAGLGGQ